MKKIVTNEYFCPSCNTPLKIENHIILTAIPEGKIGGIILFEPKLGNFNIVKHPGCEIRPGEKVEFYCPVCHSNLGVGEETLAEITHFDAHGNEYKILFSEIMGEQATFKIREGKVENYYGADSGKYMNFFGVGPEE